MGDDSQERGECPLLLAGGEVEVADQELRPRRRLVAWVGTDQGIELAHGLIAVAGAPRGQRQQQLCLWSQARVPVVGHEGPQAVARRLERAVAVALLEHQ